LGITEAITGLPFVGVAGGTLSRLLQRAGISRDTVRIHNCVSCQPPGDWLDGAPWQHSALAHCAQYLNPVLAEPHQVIVTLGATALRQVLDLWGMDGVRVQDFHGTVQQAESGPAKGAWVVPTYHPSYIQRGATNLTDVVRFDLERAKAIARATPLIPHATLHLDPSPLAFRFWASVYLEELKRNPDGVWLGVDIETEGKIGRDEGELTLSDSSTQIQRVNFAYRPDEGLTVPYEGPYIPVIDELLSNAGIVLMCFKGYDEPRLRLAGHQTIGTDIWDVAWAFHHLQSDLPLGLGFMAPLYSVCAAWKHLAKIKGREAEYAAWDAVHTVRCGHGIVRDLIGAGMWEAFYRHTHLREQYVLRPAHDIGLSIDTERLDRFHDRLQQETAARLAIIGDSEAACTLRPKHGYPEKPEGGPPEGLFGKAKEKGDQAKAGYLAERVKLVERTVTVPVKVCKTCGKDTGIGPKHKCPKYLVEPNLFTDGQPPKPEVVTVLRQEKRFFWALPFNPDASQQILKLIKDSGEEPGRAKKTRRETGGKDILKKLAKKTGNGIYSEILAYKAVKKVDSTYVVGTKNRIWADKRLHPYITFRPSTGRDSCVNPNLQNVIGGEGTLAEGFRDCIIAAPGCRLVEFDLRAVESVETGWCMGDPSFIRLAYLGVHAYLASYLMDKPASLDWSDEDLARYFAEIKKTRQDVYKPAKVMVHAGSYGLTVQGMVEHFPQIFASLKDAQRVVDVFHAIVPRLPEWHARLRDLAHQNGYLGGPFVDDYHQLTRSGKHHSFALRHWYWSVLAFKPMTQMEYRKTMIWATKQHRIDEHGRPKGVVLLNGRPFRAQLGEDAKRAIAFYPQSLAAGRLKEAQLDLFHPESESFVGDIYYGRTPFRVPIHDSLLLEVPDATFDRVVETVVGVMRAPEIRQPCPIEWGIGSHLAVDVAVKAGRTWARMDDVAIPPMKAAVAEPSDLPAEESELEDVADLGVMLQVAAVE
jgi:uracil-DNA glycosylase family 4